MRSRKVLWVSFLLGFATGCDDAVRPEHTVRIAAKSQPRTVSNPVLSDAVWSINLAECIHCHRGAPYPAGIDLATRSSLLPAQVQLVYDGVSREMAPAVGAPLARADYDSLLRWAVTNGATPYSVQIPATFSWSMNEQLAGAPLGSDATAPHRFFGFRVEDLARTGSLLVESKTDASGQTHVGIALFEQTPVDPDSFTSSTHPVNYIMSAGVPWSGRWKQMQFSGYVMVDRWAFVTFHTKLLQKGPSPRGSRERRDYVRLQIDRDFMSWRSKVPPADKTETYPWSGPDPLLTAAPGYALDVSTGYLNQSKWYRVEGSIAQVGSFMRYVAHLKDPATGSTICSVGGERSDVDDAYGSVTFGKYSESGGSVSNPKKTRFAEWEFEVQELYGSGDQNPGMVRRVGSGRMHVNEASTPGPREFFKGR